MCWRARDEHLWLLSTLALATMVQQAVGLWWGTEPRPFPRLIPQDFSAGLVDQKFWLPIAIAIVMALGLELFYRRTMYGKLFLAMSEDAFAARARGVPTDRVALAVLRPRRRASARWPASPPAS